jgi:hypothetical protein
MNEVEQLKWKIKACFHNWVITDPYPEITEHQMYESTKGAFERLFGRLKASAPLAISAHCAWRDGYEFAKALVEEELK